MPKAPADKQGRLLVQVRLPRDLVRTIDHMAIERDLYRSQMFELLVRLGLQSPEQAA